MTSRPYTAVLIRGEETKVINVDAPLERRQAKEYIQEKFPADRVIALIPGLHADHAFTYENRGSRIVHPDVTIDLFDTGYIAKNNV